MGVKVLKTYEISETLWMQIVEGFNESFGLNVTTEGMKNGFCVRNPYGYGYHAVALSDDGDLMGYNVFSPVIYKGGLKTVVSGSTFVREKYRSHEFLFMEMINALRKAVIEDGFTIEIGVPNHNSENFAIKILKFRIVDELNYYILPLNISRCLNKPNLRYLDGITKVLSHIHIALHLSFSSVFRTREQRTKYEVDLDHNYWDFRFKGEVYKKYRDKKFHAYWLPYKEDGAKAVYLMDFREGNVRTYRSLIKAINKIAKTEQVDMILFVGFLRMKQMALIKCPKRFIPKRLPLTYCILNKADRDKYSDMQLSLNWNFSLMNFDVR